MPVTLSTGRHFVTHEAGGGRRRVTFVVPGGGRTQDLRTAQSSEGWSGDAEPAPDPNGRYTVESVAVGDSGLVTRSWPIRVDVTNRTPHADARS